MGKVEIEVGAVIVIVRVFLVDQEMEMRVGVVPLNWVLLEGNEEKEGMQLRRWHWDW